MKSINSQGVCDEAIWPYDINKFTDKPTDDCYKQALLHEALKYETVDQTAEALETVISQDLPVVFGVMVYQSFEDATDGNIPMPDVNNEQLLGGHCILLVGYASYKQLFKFRNSWGDSWGQGGYGTLPYQYVLDQNLSSDFWVITLMEGTQPGPTPPPPTPPDPPTPTPIPPNPTPTPFEDWLQQLIDWLSQFLMKKK
jgi:C1A family cysteine protease